MAGRGHRQRDIPGLSGISSILALPSFFIDEINKGHSRLPHSFLESLVKVPLRAGELRLFLFLLRKTVGSQKNIVQIGIPTLARVCEMYRRSVRRALEGLISWKMIHKSASPSKSKSATYTVELDPDKWNPPVGLAERHADCLRRASPNEKHEKRHPDDYHKSHHECLRGASPLINNNIKKEKTPPLIALSLCETLYQTFPGIKRSSNDPEHFQALLGTGKDAETIRCVMQHCRESEIEITSAEYFLSNWLDWLKLYRMSKQVTA